MTADRVARRYPASAFPAITGVRVTPLGLAARLVNLSATGLLIECAACPPNGSQLNVHFAGTFVPASLQARLVRAEVAGIAADGSLRYHLGLAFTRQIDLPAVAEDSAGPREESLAAPPVVAAAAAANAPVLRNRW